MTRTRSFVTALAFGILLAHWPVGPLAAQVGVDPAHSPYRDILRGNGWTFLFGHVGGDGGPLRQSPNSGTSLGLRYDVRFSRLLGGYASVSRMSTTRTYLAHDDSVATRFHQRLDQPVWTPEIGLQMNLSGAKTWHTLAPFVAVGIGLATSGNVKSDTSGFTFGTKLLITPSAGTSMYLSERVHLRVEGELLYWKMKYPSNWLSEPVAQPGVSGEPTTAPVADVTALTDWVHTPTFRVGLGISF